MHYKFTHMKEKIAIPGPNGTLNVLLQLPAAGYAGPVTILMHGFMAKMCGLCGASKIWAVYR